MKLMIFFAFAYAAVALAINTKEQSLTDWYEEVDKKIIKSVKSGPFFEHVRGFNDWCVKQTFLNMNRDGNKKLKFPEAMIIIFDALISCKKEKSLDIWSLMVGELANHYKTSLDDPSHVECFKLELQKVEPTSYLLHGLESNSMTNDIETCKTIVDDDGYSRHIDILEQEFGKISDLTCQEFDGAEAKKLLLSIIVLGFEKRINYVNYVKKSIAADLQYRIGSAAKCIKKRMNQ
ncbi:unnamed protein product [Chironomus riparius]|uniref:Secreted protein n=1 Tax=Chironomus riparius TaxID=315576 RepID=A0A9N9S9Q5_9DIPT|nr:unnamed protein product [Chironomus riparius]